MSCLLTTLKSVILLCDHLILNSKLDSINQYSAVIIASGEEGLTVKIAASFYYAAKFGCFNLCQKSIKLEIRED